MSIAQFIESPMVGRGFTFTSSNEYTGTERYIKRISSIRARNRRYHSCAVVVETYSETFVVFSIYGIAPKTGYKHNLTRDLYPGIYHLVQKEDINQLIPVPVSWASEYAF